MLYIEQAPLKCPTLSMMPYLKNGVSLSQRQTGSLQQNQLQSEMGEKENCLFQ